MAPNADRRRSHQRGTWQAVLLAVVIVIASIMVPPVVGSHGDGEDEESVAPSLRELAITRLVHHQEQYGSKATKAEMKNVEQFETRRHSEVLAEHRKVHQGSDRGALGRRGVKGDWEKRVSGPVTRLTHVVNTFCAEPGSTLYYEQPLMYASLRRAVSYAAERGILVEVIAPVFEKDFRCVEKPAKAVMMEHSIRDSIPADHIPPLPLVMDVLRMGYQYGTADWLVFTNADICLTPDAYVRMAALLEEHRTALTITRRTVHADDKVDHRNEMEYLYSMVTPDRSASHPGFDCYVIPREWVPSIDIGSMMLGMPNWNAILNWELTVISGSLSLTPLVVLREEFITFHLNDERDWAASCNVLSVWEQMEFIRVMEERRVYEDLGRWNDPARSPSLEAGEKLASWYRNLMSRLFNVQQAEAGSVHQQRCRLYAINIQESACMCVSPSGRLYRHLEHCDYLEDGNSAFFVGLRKSCDLLDHQRRLWCSNKETSRNIHCRKVFHYEKDVAQMASELERTMLMGSARANAVLNSGLDRDILDASPVPLVDNDMDDAFEQLFDDGRPEDDDTPSNGRANKGDSAGSRSDSTRSSSLPPAPAYNPWAPAPQSPDVVAPAEESRSKTDTPRASGSSGTYHDPVPRRASGETDDNLVAAAAAAAAAAVRPMTQKPPVEIKVPSRTAEQDIQDRVAAYQSEAAALIPQLLPAEGPPAVAQVPVSPLDASPAFPSAVSGQQPAPSRAKSKRDRLRRAREAGHQSPEDEIVDSDQYGSGNGNGDGDGDGDGNAESMPLAPSRGQQTLLEYDLERIAEDTANGLSREEVRRQQRVRMKEQIEHDAAMLTSN